MTPSPLPLRIDRGAVQERAMQALTRAAIVIASTKLNPGIRQRDILQRWSSDESARVELVLRAASSPANTTVTGWARELSHLSIALLANLVGTRAAADLF